RLDRRRAVARRLHLPDQWGQGAGPGGRSLAHPSALLIWPAPQHSIAIKTIAMVGRGLQLVSLPAVKLCGAKRVQSSPAVTKTRRETAPWPMCSKPYQPIAA